MIYKFRSTRRGGEQQCKRGRPGGAKGGKTQERIFKRFLGNERIYVCPSVHH